MGRDVRTQPPVTGPPVATAATMSPVPLVRRAGGLAMLLLASAALFSFDLGTRVLGTNDEARFPMLARDILERGHWLVPRLNGVVHLNKPPVMAWLIALSAWPGGAVTQSRAVVPSLLAGLGTTLGTYCIARRLAGPAAGLMAGLGLATMYGVLEMVRVPMPDILLCCALTFGFVAFLSAELDGRRTLPLFYALIGFASLAKGPAGLVALVVVVVYAVTTHGRRGLRRLVSPLGLLLLLLLAVPWWVHGALEGGAATVGSVMRSDWLGWYLPHGPWRLRMLTEPIVQPMTILLPWSLLAPLALFAAPPVGNEARRRGLRLVRLWAAVVFAAMAVSHEQRFRYYLPLCPPVAIAIGMWWAAIPGRRAKALFAAVWLFVAVGQGTWEASARARYNAGTDLRAIVEHARGAAYTFCAVEVPELVLGFYLEREVLPLPDYQRCASIAAGRTAVLFIADRALPRAALVRDQPLARGTINRRAFSMLVSS